MFPVLSFLSFRQSRYFPAFEEVRMFSLISSTYQTLTFKKNGCNPDKLVVSACRRCDVRTLQESAALKGQRDICRGRLQFKKWSVTATSYWARPMHPHGRSALCNGGTTPWALAQHPSTSQASAAGMCKGWKPEDSTLLFPAKFGPALDPTSQLSNEAWS
jgi:hypothetical protein